MKGKRNAPGAFVTFSTLLASFLVIPANGQPPSLAEATIQPAVAGVLAAFRQHPLVVLADRHGFTEVIAFYEAIIRDPHFAEEVRNVVVEFGGAQHQDLIDRYTNGAPVPYQQLRQVWTDTVGWSPTIEHLGYTHFFAQVRETNRGRPPERRIRVLLGEPPIAWDRIRTRDEFLEILGTRDRHAASVIGSVLARHEKALVIYGGGHFGRVSVEEEALRAEWAKQDPKGAQPARENLQGIVEAQHPAAFFVVREYIGFSDEDCAIRFEERMAEWPLPALAVNARATTLQRDTHECQRQNRDALKFPETVPEALQTLLREQIADDLFAGDADAVLFVAKSASLTESPLLPDLYLDDEYREEISRRALIRTGQALPQGWGGTVPFTPGARK